MKVDEILISSLTHTLAPVKVTNCKFMFSGINILTVKAAAIYLSMYPSS